MLKLKATKRIFSSLTSILMLAITMFTGVVHAQDSDLPSFIFNGFGTLGLVHSSEDQADFVSAGLKHSGAGYTNNWSAAVDSLIAGQLTANFTPKLTAVVQAVVEQNYDNSYRPHVEWANLQYKFTPDFNIRVGRIALASFLVSNYRKVGYANPWVRPTIELYAMVPITTNDGVDINYHFRSGELSNSIQFIYGKNKNKVPKSQGGGTVEASDAIGLFYTAEYRATTIHMSYLTGNLAINSVYPLYDGFRQFGPEGLAIADKYDPNNSAIDFIGVGGNYDPGAWFFTGELGYTESDSQIGRRLAWYLSAGYRFGALTPYITYSDRKLKSDPFAPGLSLTSLPPFLVDVAAQLNQGLNSTLRTEADQQTFSIGLRWDLISNVALKFQFDHSKIGSDVSTGTLINVQPGFQPKGTYNLLSATIDFVF